MRVCFLLRCSFFILPHWFPFKTILVAYLLMPFLTHFGTKSERMRLIFSLSGSLKLVNYLCYAVFNLAPWMVWLYIYFFKNIFLTKSPIFFCWYLEPRPLSGFHPQCKIKHLITFYFPNIFCASYYMWHSVSE